MPAQSKPFENMVAYLVSLIFAAVAIANGIGLFFLMRASRRQFSWVRTPAEITKSVVGNRLRTVAATVEYSYVFDGKPYQGNTVRSGLIQYNRSAPAKNISTKYPAGLKTNAYVCPANPRHAVLEPGIDPMIIWALGAACALCILLAAVAAVQ